MIRLCNAPWSDCRYHLMDTETKDFLGKCEVVTGWYRGEKVNEIWSVRIFEEFQRKGYATLMLKRIIKKYKGNVLPLVLYVAKDNDIAMHLYKKLGFEIIGKYSSNAWAMQYKPNRQRRSCYERRN